MRNCFSKTNDAFIEGWKNRDAIDWRGFFVTLTWLVVSVGAIVGCTAFGAYTAFLLGHHPLTTNAYTFTGAGSIVGLLIFVYFTAMMDTCYWSEDKVNDNA